MAAAPIAVVLVDDQPLQREGQRLVLGTQPDMEVVGEAGDGAQALALLRRTRADVVLMDARMPRVNGFTATERILADEEVRAQGAPPRVILLTALDLDEQLPTAARAGAFAMLYKDAPVETVLDAIRSAAKGRAAH